MTQYKRLFLAVGPSAASVMAGSLFDADIAKAGQSALIACIKNYSELGISPDVALGSVKKPYWPIASSN